MNTSRDGPILKQVHRSQKLGHSGRTSASRECSSNNSNGRGTDAPVSDKSHDCGTNRYYFDGYLSTLDLHIQLTEKVSIVRFQQATVSLQTRPIRVRQTTRMV